jgi:hypothetical protein
VTTSASLLHSHTLWLALDSHATSVLLRSPIAHLRTARLHLTSDAMASATPGGSRDRVAEALHSWCKSNRDIGHVFSQDELLRSQAIPNNDLKVLLEAVQNLVSKNLFRTHDIKGANTIGWELISQERAEKYSTSLSAG